MTEIAGALVSTQWLADHLEAPDVRVVDATQHAGGVLRHDAFLSNPEVRAVVRRAIERGG